jgi:hypothetical protein
MDTRKQPRGRPFAKGNPGRKPGSKNKATLLAASLTREQGEELLRKAYEMAMEGNVAIMKFLLDRILPKERPIQIELPHLDFANDSVDALANRGSSFVGTDFASGSGGSCTTGVSIYRSNRNHRRRDGNRFSESPIGRHHAELKMNGVGQKDQD